MPDFSEQQKIVSSLREKCRECDESLYRARLKLHRANHQLRRAEQKHTIPNPDRDTDVTRLRAEIARLNHRLAALRERAREVAQWLAQLSDQRKLAAHLQQNLIAIKERIRELRDEIAELQQRVPPPTDKITARQSELERLERVRADIESSLRDVTENIRRHEQTENDRRADQEHVQREQEEAREELRATQSQLTDRLQPAFPDPIDLGDRREQAATAVERLKAACGDCEGQLKDAITELYPRDAHPRDALRNVDDGTPFLLFPVRIETIFVPAQVPTQPGEPPSQPELWVRVYPDEIAVHTHEKTLTDREVLAGELYWTELVTAEHLRDERDKRRRACWRHLVELFGGQRAAWIGRQTKPSDFDALVAAAAAATAPTLLDLVRSLDEDFLDELLALDLPAATRTELENIIVENDGDAFARLADRKKWFDRINKLVRTMITGFPAHDLTKTDAWSRAPRAYVMPDRFVLLLYSSETALPREIVGGLVSDTLFLGPDPLDSTTGFNKKDETLVYGTGFDWMSDFGKAVDEGMGFRVTLTADEARVGFAKALVLGVFLSASADESAELLEELVDNHQFSPKGFSIVPQGTPTNNTERDGTGYSDNDPYDDLAFYTAIDLPAFDPLSTDPKKSQTDGRLLADALGISYSPMQTVQHADQTDIIEAWSMSTALFPGTLGYWLKNWMSPVVAAQTARHARSFFTRFVSGRGPLPAIRIGNQPYGVLVTSDLSRWKYPDSDGPFVLAPLFGNFITFLKKLHDLLVHLDDIWDDIVKTLPFVGKAGSDSSDVLMNILGLHPTSVEFFQRIGYSHEYLRNLFSFKDGRRYEGELNSHMLGMPAIARSYLLSLGIEIDAASASALRSVKVLWQHYTTSLDVPNLVENKPPSEANKLSVNYIEFLAAADTTQKIISQAFPSVPPASLLYLMLRNALLLQLHNGAYEWLKERATFEPALEEATQSTTLAGMRASLPTVSKLELMSTKVEIAEPSSAVPSMSVADWIWNGPSTTDVEAAYLKEQKAALLNLKEMPTARLERCLVEHLDCCNYRLDAWETGLFAQRLQGQRGSGQSRKAGVYLGAFGWVENLTPAVKVFIRPESLPPSLRPTDTRPILEEDDVIKPRPSEPVGSRRGGYVHAPSLNHAAAAALLRNAYLSHARPEQSEMFSVNISSERVRRAQFVLEGMRNGQPIEALLGYQFERGLHDRTSASAARGDVPVLELNQFILPYRQAFTFESLEIAQAGTGGPTETVPPYSVVNGLKLSKATLSVTNAFGLASVLPAAEQPNANQGTAILAEQNALLDTLDAVKDLLTAENAFQLVRGNFDRVAAVSLAQKEGHIPPDLEVVKTPRGTEFTFTNRVTLHFDDLDPSLLSSNPWTAIPMTPRASAEPGMNKWLGSLLGPPDRVLCDVFWVDEDDVDDRHDVHPVTVADLRVQPIDFVWMVNISMEETSGATGLETRIAHQYRVAHNIEDAKIVRIEFNPVVEAVERTFAQLFPLARHLRSLLAESKALDAGDFLPAAGGKETTTPVDEANPKGYDEVELRTRVQGVLGELTALADSIDGASAPTVQLVFLKDPATAADDETFVVPLGDAFDELQERKLTFADSNDVTVSFSLGDAETLQQKLRAIAGFGLADAFPHESDLTAQNAKLGLLSRAHRVARRLRNADPVDGVLDRSTALVSAATPTKSVEQNVALLLEAGRILFAETLNWLPKFTCYNEVDLVTADTDRTQLLKYATDNTPGITEEEVVEEWLQGVARVRRPLHRWDVVRTLADVLNDATVDLRPVQVPYRANDSWLAVEFPKKDPNNTDPEDPDKKFGISRDTLSIAAHGTTAFQVGTRQSGLLIDDWTEEIPTSSEITGIGFRFNQPNAVPPQTLLLAVTPEETGSWEWDDLVGTLNDTLRRAKRRAVEPEQLEKQGLAWNAFDPALVSEFSTLEKNDVSLDLMSMMDFKSLKDFYSKR